jgi:hypothetical protein
MKDCKLFPYDNTRIDISFTQRYNDFLENHLAKISPSSWIIFCDQGFSFAEDFKKTLRTLAPNCIYGVMGAESRRRFSWKHFKFVNEIVKVGGVMEDRDRVPPTKRRFKKPRHVDTIDGCCMIVNAELLQDFHLSFNEKLPFYFYVEEFCLAAFYKYKIKSMALPLNAYYTIPKEFPPEYYESRDYLKAEYNLDNFACYGAVQPNPTRYSLDNMVETVIETVVGIYKD